MAIWRGERAPPSGARCGQRSHGLGEDDPCPQDRAVGGLPSDLRTLLDFTRDPPAGIGGFLPNGIAVGPDGVIYLDTYAGNGYSAKTALIEVRPGGHVRVLWQS